MSTESKTPRTDIMAVDRHDGSKDFRDFVVPADFARQLETELAAERAMKRQWEAKFAQTHDTWAAQGVSEQEKISNLQAGLDAERAAQIGGRRVLLELAEAKRKQYEAEGIADDQRTYIEALLRDRDALQQRLAESEKQTAQAGQMVVHWQHKFAESRSIADQKHNQIEQLREAKNALGVHVEHWKEKAEIAEARLAAAESALADTRAAHEETKREVESVRLCGNAETRRLIVERDALQQRLAESEKSREEAVGAHKIQADNYIKLHDAIIGDGTQTADFKDPIDIVSDLRARLTAAESALKAAEGQKTALSIAEMLRGWADGWEVPEQFRQMPFLLMVALAEYIETAAMQDQSKQ